MILHEFLAQKIKTAHQNSDPPGHMPPNSQEVFRKHQTCAQHQVFIYELSAETSRPGTLKFPTIEPFLPLSPFSPRRPIPPGSSFFAACFASLSQLVSRLVSRPFSRIFSHCERTPQSHAILEIMSDAIENTTGSADSNDKTKLIGRESDVVPGRFGEPLQITHVQYSRGGGNTAPKRPLFLCLHGWGSNETDLADMMRYVAPYNDFASLRAPLTLQPAGRFAPGAYSWLHDCVDTGEDLDRDAFAAAKAIDDWVSANIPDDRAVVPIGFSQGGLLAIHLLRVHPERYAATISLSGFLAPGTVAGTAPADDRVAELNIPTFFGYGKNDTVIPMPELFATAAWLDEHTFLTEKSYRGLDHSVSMEEFSDLRDWLAAHNIAPGIL